jgi:hypothetical protein
MRRFHNVGIALVGIGIDSRRVYLAQFVLKFFSFHIRDRLFEFAYSLNQRRALLVSRENALAGVYNCALEFEDLALNKVGRVAAGARGDADSAFVVLIVVSPGGRAVRRGRQGDCPEIA